MIQVSFFRRTRYEYTLMVNFGLGAFGIDFLLKPLFSLKDTNPFWGYGKQLCLGYFALRLYIGPRWQWRRSWRRRKDWRTKDFYGLVHWQEGGPN